MRRGKRPAIGAHSLVWKLFGWTAGCIAAVLLAVLLFDTFALKSYYVREKQKQVEQAFASVNAACNDIDALQSRLDELQDRGAVSTVLWSGGRVLYGTINFERFRMLGQLAYPPGEYDMTVTREDSFMGEVHDGQAILLVGTLDNGWHIYQRASVAAIEESVALQNRFLLIVGSGALVLGLLMVLWVARRYVRPIRELGDVADRVARLELSARCGSTRRDELGELGRSVDAMAEALERAVGELQSANRQLEEDIRQKDRQDAARRAFIANVSHELKTPIALIGSYAEALRENVAAGGEVRDEYCAVIEDEVHRIGQMLRRMTMLMQLEDGSDRLEPERFDITELAVNLCTRLRPSFAARSIALAAPENGSVYVVGDPYLIENVLENYLSNALHHTPDGGRTAVRIVPLWENGRPARVRIAVENTGSHIPPDELPRIWESFYKVDKARTRAYGGSGIGLSVVAAIMNAHGMPYGVENTPDGVRFTIELSAGDAPSCIEPPDTL